MINNINILRTDSCPPNPWISGYWLENILASNIENLSKDNICFTIPGDVKLNLDTIIRFLNLINQLTTQGKLIEIVFTNEECDVFKYLLAVGFFNVIDNKVKIFPVPIVKTENISENREHSTLVKLTTITSDKLDKLLPSLLANALVDNIKCKKLKESSGKLRVIFQTIFSELTNNVHEHSQTRLDGFVGLQAYGGKNPRAEVIVCDSGEGLLETLKPTLEHQYNSFTDTEIICEMLKKGMTSKASEDDGGNGLQTCFRHAKKMNSDLDIRFSNYQYSLVRLAECENLADAFKVRDDFVDVMGTYFCFKIPLN